MWAGRGVTHHAVDLDVDAEVLLDGAQLDEILVQGVGLWGRGGAGRGEGRGGASPTML